MRARRLTAVALAFVAALAVFTATRGGGRAAAGPPAGLALDARPAGSTAEEVRRLQAAVRRGEPREPELAAAYAQRARETGDATFYARAESVLGPRPQGAAALTEAAALAAARHDFRRALALARRARAAAPGVNAPFAVLVDALVELGRYDAAERTLARMVGPPARPRRLRPHLVPARAARRPRRRRAPRWPPRSRPPARSPSTRPTRNALLGELELRRGRPAAAARAFRTALAAVPRHAAASAGLAPPRRRERPAGRRDRPLAAARRPAAAAGVRHRPRRGAARRRAPRPRRGAASTLVRAQEAIQRDARRRHRRRARRLRGRPRRPRPGGRARPPGLGERAQRALRRRAGLGADARRPPARRAALGAPRAGPGLARPARAAPRGDRGAGGRPARGGRAPAAAPRCAAGSRSIPLAAREAREALR